VTRVVAAHDWSEHGVCPAETTHVGELARVLARSFHDDPVHRWLFSDPARMERRHADFFAHLLAYYMRTMLVLTTPALEGAALWEPPRAEPRVLDQLRLTWRIAGALGWRALRVGVSFSELPRLHPPGPHWYLAVLGTDPRRQGNGVGARLMRAVLARCDAEGVPAYLEASREENVPYYRRFGFEVIAPYPLPGGPTVWRMVRKAECECGMSNFEC